ncbi:hypothetical protein [Lactobacillus sp.]|uniref:hypothetical protein n=1 Tax=Lactobacillus sp. TaxID=1591 RepID=UPI00198EAEC3|nr:hypothetical protein [Lactobacillus sp.]MBD5429698.1 hypothetical protein [Lactobacillus sp.]
MLSLIHKLENKYGSIAKAPNSDSDFKKLREITTHTIFDDVAKVISQGYSADYCSKSLNVTIHFIKGVARRRHIKIYPKFRYKLNDTFYFLTKSSLCEWGHTSRDALALNRLRKKYQIEEGNYELPDMPINSIYIDTNGHEQLKYSNNVKDYII